MLYFPSPTIDAPRWAPVHQCLNITVIFLRSVSMRKEQGISSSENLVGTYGPRNNRGRQYVPTRNTFFISCHFLICNDSEGHEIAAKILDEPLACGRKKVALRLILGFVWYGICKKGIVKFEYILLNIIPPRTI